MTDARDAWRAIGSRVESLGLKLRYHFEQERSEHEDEPEMRGLQRLTLAIDDVADSVEHAVKDEAVKADVKDILAALPGALADTFNQVADEVRAARGKNGTPPADSGQLEESDPEQPPPA